MTVADEWQALHTMSLMTSITVFHLESIFCTMIMKVCWHLSSHPVDFSHLALCVKLKSLKNCERAGRDSDSELRATLGRSPKKRTQKSTDLVQV